jgi:hypothetical protein
MLVTPFWYIRVSASFDRKRDIMRVCEAVVAVLFESLKPGGPRTGAKAVSSLMKKISPPYYKF